MNSHDIERISRLLPFLSSVSAEDWKRTEVLEVDPSTPHSIREGHMLNHAIFILAGCIRVYKISELGREITLYRIKAGQSCVLMLASILGETPYEASVSIEGSSQVLLIPVELFQQWMNTIQPLRQYVYKQIIEKITSVTSLLEDVAFKPIHYRLAAYLYQSTDAKTLEVKATHEQLSIELGTAREVISRSLKDFEKRGFVSLSRGKINVLNRDSLNIS
jgi:CRP/FNR family transcriptional regulator, anaerobic regulatory protein